MVTELDKEKKDKSGDDVKSLKDKLSEYEQELEDFKAKEGEDVKPNMEFDIIRDPWNVHDPYYIKAFIPPDNAFPKGQALSWKSINYRETRGWRGWEIMTWDDPYVKHLENCIPDPPKRMEGHAKDNNYITRGDLVLCRLDKRIFDQRQWERVKESNKRRKITSQQPVSTATGIKVIGKGMERDDRSGGYLISRVQEPGPE